MSWRRDAVIAVVSEVNQGGVNVCALVSRGVSPLRAISERLHEINRRSIISSGQIT